MKKQTTLKIIYWIIYFVFVGALLIVGGESTKITITLLTIVWVLIFAFIILRENFGRKDS